MKQIIELLNDQILILMAIRGISLNHIKKTLATDPNEARKEIEDLQKDLASEIKRLAYTKEDLLLSLFDYLKKNPQHDKPTQSIVKDYLK